VRGGERGLGAADASSEHSPGYQPVGIVQLFAYVSTLVGVDFNYIIHDAWTMVAAFPIMRLTTPGLMAQAHRHAPIRTFAADRRPVHAPAQVQIGPMYEYSSGSSTDPLMVRRFSGRFFPSPIDRKALTDHVAPQDQHSRIVPRLWPRLAKASAAFVAVRRDGCCETRTTGVTQLPVPPTREQMAFTSARHSMASAEPPTNASKAAGTTAWGPGQDTRDCLAGLRILWRL